MTPYLTEPAGEATAGVVSPPSTRPILSSAASRGRVWPGVRPGAGRVAGGGAGRAARPFDPLARAVFLTALRRATGGAVSVLEDGRGEVVRAEGYRDAGVGAGAGAGAHSHDAGDVAAVTVTVHDPAAFPAVLLGGSVGLGRSYVAGWWDCDDLVGLFRLATRALPAPDSLRAALAGVVGRLRGEHSGRADDLARDRADIAAHYDLGDDFFALFLDPTLTYSCGIFESPSATMEEASLTKLDRICAKLRLRPGDEVLEIGTGWGSFALHAAGRYGCHVTTTTISENQFRTARRRVAEAGLCHLVTVRNEDYRDLRGTYDRVVSIEMIEAIGWRQQGRFFQACADRLRPDGAMALQAIVIDDRVYERAKRQEDFIKAVVFPGSSIPSVASITAATGGTDLSVVEREDIGPHYAETLARWRARFTENQAEIACLGGTELLRLWAFYLAYCQAGFAERRIGDVQLVLAKPGWPPAFGVPGKGAGS